MHKFIRNFSNQITDFHVISDCKLLGIHQKIYLRSHTAKLHSTSYPRHQSNQNSLFTFSISYIVLRKEQKSFKIYWVVVQTFIQCRQWRLTEPKLDNISYHSEYFFPSQASINFNIHRECGPGDGKKSGSLETRDSIPGKTKRNENCMDFIK